MGSHPLNSLPKIRPVTTVAPPWPVAGVAQKRRFSLASKRPRRPSLLCPKKLKRRDLSPPPSTRFKRRKGRFRCRGLRRFQVFFCCIGLSFVAGSGEVNLLYWCKAGWWWQPRAWCALKVHMGSSRGTAPETLGFLAF
ncbi:uncharacterized protein [Gossypium hirsutum]|uniref:Uncharacterized protein n=1 Tax=Gossypium hirsutum TaxID=3635 RepID=A0ABM3BA69_GOSHI|nr:uncharacterized protein LOC121224555 [Gossypium hirsutum]